MQTIRLKTKLDHDSQSVIKTGLATKKKMLTAYITRPVCDFGVIPKRRARGATDRTL